MAALPAGVQYGLSSESSYKENKELVFVKLTDSALKAIEDFIRNNRDKLAKPKIQFLPGNEGKISIPAPASGNGSAGEATFHFSINSNAEMEGPQGSFECVRGGGARRLETCGPLPRRMRVQANDDSYEATKDRMARTIATEQSKCTRVIKPNQTDIGRRVKVRTSHNPLFSLSRSIKERLIQLLALKPFKKPELYARLNSEGVKEKERSVVNKILPQIGTLKDNCYHLRRHMWNDVNEDWPFYSEEEKRMLKRRKPQNLTPPLTKKQRISHYRRPSPPSSGYATTSSGERHASDNEDDRTTVKKDNGYTLNFTTVKDLCPSPVKTNGFRNSPPVEQSSITEKDITNTEPLVENTELTSVPEENMTDLEEIERQYPPITSSSTRRAYKNEFAELYQEYRTLYARVARVAATFTQLEHQLKRAQPHSPHHQSIEQRIVEEYRRVRNDAVYQQQRRRVNYLHRKLTHIKRMVHQYDQLRNLKPERVAAASTTQAY
ncbi:RNA polymerase II elongation factor ELL domain-containing protein [Phthorimaea operculella]|nr:RNA polymerase II elongation factor ELL domain-containing protein [Phthorimaea operculella]